MASKRKERSIAMQGTQNTLQMPDYIVLAGYFVLMLAIGAYFYRHMRGIKDYFSGGNKIPWWLSGVSFYMSSFSVAAFIFYPALCYKYGWVGVTLLWVAVPATLFSTLLFAVRWRRARIDSPVEYLETRYSPALRQLFAWQGVPVKVIDDGIKIFAIGSFISAGLGFPMRESMLGTGLIMLIYTFMGGLWAVTVTDFVQFVVLTVAILIILPLSVARAGGLSHMIETAPEGFFRLTVPEYGWHYVIPLMLLYCLAWSSINWPLIQRYFCVPKEKDAMKVGFLVVGLYIIGPPMMFLPAMAAASFLPDLANPKDVYPILCAMLLPAGMLGLVIAAMFAATMSMLSSDYNVCAGVLTNDVYRRFIRPNASQKELVLTGRIMTILIGVIALATAFLIAQGSGEDLFRIMVTLFSVATGPVAIPMLLGLLSRRFSNTGAITGFIAGLTAGIAFFVVSRQPEPFTVLGMQWNPAGQELIIAGVAWKMEIVIFLGSAFITFVVMALGSILWPSGAVARARIDAFMQRLEDPIGAREEDRDTEADASAISPFRVVGLSIFAIGALMLVVLPWSGGALTFSMDLFWGLLLAVIGAAMYAASAFGKEHAG